MLDKRFITLIDVEINQVVYLRRDKKIVAAKYLGFVSKRLDVTTHLFERADGKKENICVSDGYVRGNYYSVYPTIEDAINDTNAKQYYHNDFTSFLIKNLGFSIEVNCVGRKELGLVKWKWDSYQPISTHILHECFDINFNGEWSCKLTFNDAEKYYNTAEECRKNNHIDVVTF